MMLNGMRVLPAPKWSYVTRRITDRGRSRVGTSVREPRLGDLVGARVLSIGVHEFIEDVAGRRVRLYPGDMIVGAYGNRYATDFFEGYLPTGPQAHLLTAGGLIGAVASAHTRHGPPTTLGILGPLIDHTDTPLSLEDFTMPAAPPATAELGTIVVLGTSMNAGKTTTAAATVRGWARAGLRAGAGKVTGSGSGKDRWAYLDAGATAVADFMDFGMPSTFGYPIERLQTTMIAIRDTLAHDADAVVLEIADGLLQNETRQLAATVPHFADGVLLAVADALGAVAGVDLLRELGVPVLAVSGLVTASPLASREVAAATDLDVLSPSDLANGSAVDILAAAAPRESSAL